MPDARDLDLTFPTGGIDVSWGHDMQPGGTTAAGVNVRAFEARTQRTRGGSRPGLSRYIDATVAGTHLIQHLNIIVDPTTDALLDDFEPPLLTGEGENDPSGRDWVQDPSSAGSGEPSQGGNADRNPGRRVRRGGSGRQPNKSTRRRQANVAYVQANVEQNDPTSLSLAFLANVTAGSLLIFFELHSNRTDISTPALNPVASVTDSLGNVYTRGHANQIDDLFNLVLYDTSIWYAISASGGACTVTATLTAAPQLVYNQKAVAEYTGVKQSAPLDGANGVFDLANTPTIAPSSGEVPVTVSGGLLFAAAGGVATDAEPVSGFTKRTGPVTAGLRVVLFDLISPSGSAAATMARSVIYEGVVYDIQALSFKPRT